jgi:hypothetical protein
MGGKRRKNAKGSKLPVKTKNNCYGQKTTDQRSDVCETYE